jgi:undecaprenyl-diphosphatase
MNSLSLWSAALLGVIEGITEFLPISSTFHLIFASQLLSIPATPFVTMFEVAIQAGAILAVPVVFAKQIWQERALWPKVIASFIPTAIIGFVLHKIIKTYFFESNWLMISVFILVGVIFLAYEWWLKKSDHQPDHDLETLTWQQAVLVGLAQAMAVVPGVSRAGAVLLGMMVLGIKRKDAAHYSFLLAVPTICAAAVLDVYKMRHELGADSSGVVALLVGAGVAFIVAALVLQWLIKYLQRHTLVVFGWYRLLVGIPLAIWLLYFAAR